MKPWLVLDVPYLCWRAYHTTGHLAEGVLFGFFRNMVSIKDLFSTNNLAFCFDFGESKRKKIYPQYKSKRRGDLSEEEKRERQKVNEQIELLRSKYLTRVGHKNIYYQQGYEADDCIASFVQNMMQEEQAIIVSSDHDFYQLLSDTVMIWNPHPHKKQSAYGINDFRKQWGIEPNQWVLVKSIAGCKSDCIEGVPGVGEKTACKFVNRTLSPFSSIWSKITLAPEPVRNKPLVQLPFKGIMRCRPKRGDRFNPIEWRKLMIELGMKSLV